jgi:rhomboid protease GluP
MAQGQLRTTDARRRVSAIRACPVTLLCTLASVFLFAAAVDFDQDHPDDRFGGKGRYGALTALAYTAEPQLHGLFQLWGERWYEGESWRVLVTGFHHGGLSHLLLNLVGLVYLGRLLEPRLGSVKFLVLFLVSIVVANIPHVMMNESVVGLSGGIYALFGMLLPLRETDDEVAERLPDLTVLLMLLWIPVGILLTLSDVMPIGNAAHLTGLIYGWLAGRAIFPAEKRRWCTPRTFAAAHLLVVPAFVLACHPVWNARFHWYRAMQTDDLDQRIAHLDTALAWDPRLAGAWRLLADSYARQDNQAEKWRAALQAVKCSPADEKSTAMINAMWFHTSPADRELALQTLGETFPNHESEWRKQLGLFTPPTLPPYRRLRRYLSRVRVRPPAPFIPPGIDLFWSPVDGRRVATPQPLHAPHVDPNRPDSAELGRLL